MDEEIFDFKFIERIRDNFDWFEKAKYLCILQGVLTMISINCIYSLFYSDMNKYALIAMIVLGETASLIFSKMVKIIREENKNLSIKVDSK